MTVEQLHDALTLLPADLVAEADKRRSRKPKVLHWQRLTAMAACFAVLLGCGLVLRHSASGGGKGSMRSAAMVADQAPSLMLAEAAPEVPAEAENGMSKMQGTGENAPFVAQSSGSVQGGASFDTGSLAPGVLDVIWVQTPVPPAANVSGTPSVRALVTSRAALDSFLESSLWDMEALEEASALWDEGWFESHDLLLAAMAATEERGVLNIQEEEGQWTVYVPSSEPSEETNFYHILIITEKGLIPSADAVNIAFD